MAFYMGLFKIYEVEIIASEKCFDSYLSEPTFTYKYLIKFQSGKLKYVKSDRVIII